MSNFNKAFTDLLGNPMFNMGVGLLAAGGRRQGPRVSTGQGLMEAMNFTNDRQFQMNQLNQQRQQLQAQKKQQQAVTGLSGLLSGPQPQNVPAAIRHPNAIQNHQNQMMGLLAQANPQAFTQVAAQNLLTPPQGQAYPSKVRETIAVTGVNPGEPGFEEAHVRVHGQLDPADAAQLKLLGIQTKAAELELAESEAEARARVSQLRQDTNMGLRSLSKLYEANQVLKDTFMQSGRVLPESRREFVSLVSEIKDRMGWDSSKENAILEAFDVFQKETQLLTQTLAGRYGATTNMQYRGVADSIPNIGLNPNANDMLIKDAIENLLNGAVDMEIDVPNADSYRNLGAGVPGPAGYL